MTDSDRQQILSAITANLAGERDNAQARTAVADRLVNRPRGATGTLPAQASADNPHLRAERFIAAATRQGMTAQRLSGPSRIPHAVADYLVAAGLPMRVTAASNLTDLPWNRRPSLRVDFQAVLPDTTVTVTWCQAGILETGALLVMPGAGQSLLPCLLPTIHIALLPESGLIDGYEDAWDRMRDATNGPPAGMLIAGPSRTGDIEQIILPHAHGPGRVHVLLIADGTGDAHR